MVKKLFAVLIIAAFIIVLFFAFIEPIFIDPDKVADDQTVVCSSAVSKIMTVHFIDVGQGDSIFIDYEDYEILVDAGGNSSGEKVVDYINPYVDDNLELIIATHVHEDHIGGLDTVIESYVIERIIDSGDTATTITYKDYHHAALNEINVLYHSDEDTSIDLGGGAFFKIIETGDNDRNVNNNSVVSMVEYNDIKVLLTGDMESPTEKANLDKFIDIDVLKAGHHGSRTASCQEFLDVVKPEAIIISCGVHNSYGHPHFEALNRFESLESEIYCTFESGSIVLTTDGYSYSLDADLPLNK